MTPIRAEINPAILCWARQTSGMSIDDAAKKIGLSTERLQALEAGEGYPTLTQLRAIGRVYKRPTAIFYRSKPLSDPENIPDFRLVADSEPMTQELLFEIRRAIERREIAKELSIQLGENVTDSLINIDRANGSMDVAARIREMLRIPLEEQFSWPNEYAALRNWISVVEKLGVLVFQVGGIDVQQFRGFSLTKRPYPVIGLNAKDSARGRIFTIMHELTHLVLNQGGICDHSEGQEIEVFCNGVAGEVLVPASEFVNEDSVRNIAVDTWEDWQVTKLANKYSVSNEVIYRRLLLLKRISKRFYEQKHHELKAIYQKQRDSQGFLLYHRRVMRDNGPKYTGLVLNAYNQEAITARDLLNFLGGIKFKHISKIEEEMDKRLERGISLVLD